jgi:DNA-directed RNA polymerase II subunit RPB2
MLPALLSKQVVFDAMASERAAMGVASHHLQSMDQMLEHHLPNIIMERPEIVAETANSIHVIEFTHVHIDKPVAKTEGGFYDWIEPASAKAARHTYANPIIIDAVHRVYTNTNVSEEITWEAIGAESIDKEIQLLEEARLDKRTPCRSASKRNAPKQAPKERPKGRKRTVLDSEQKDWTLVEERTYRQVNQFHMPTMIRSIGCRNRDDAPIGPNDRNDVDGYFIVKGTEKTLQTQRRLHINRCYVFPSSTPAKWTWTGEIRACHAAKIRSTSTLRIQIKTGSNGSGVLKGVVEMPYIEIGIPILAVCVVLGFRTAEEVAVCAATGGVLSGVSTIPPGSLWDTHLVHTARLWILSLLRDGAQNHPAFETMSRSKILQWIGEEGTKRKTPGDRAKYAAHIMANEFLPQLGLNSSPLTISRKGQFFAMMLRMLADVARGLIDPDDRDHAGNRQYDTAGMLCATLARQHYRNFRKKLSSEIRRFMDAKRFVSIPDLLNIKRMTDGFAYAMSTGNWGLQKGGSTQTGVAQMLNRMNPIATLSHLRRVDTPLKREGKQAKPRQLHVSSFGHTCPAETPEGPACGLVEQFSQGTHVCQGHAAEKLIRRTAAILGGSLIPLIEPSVLTGEMARLPALVSIRSPDTRKLQPMVLDHEPEEWEAVRAMQRATDHLLLENTTDKIGRVLINGIMIGFVADIKLAARKLRQARRHLQLPFDAAVEENEQRGLLCITGEAGGLRRPLFFLDGEGTLDAVARLHEECQMEPPEVFWRKLIQRGLVEYLSKHEEENMLVLSGSCTAVKLHASIEDHTHCEIHPSMMMGIAAAAIPFSDHNQAPRTSYYASMCKQTAAMPGPEIPYTNGLRLWYPQRQLVATWTSKVHGMWDAASGANAWIVVASLDGKNQEDSLYMNEDSKNRGMFACTVTRTFTEDCQGGTGADSQHFEKPPSFCRGRKTGNYNKLSANGFLTPGEHVKGGDAIIGKTMDVNEMGCVKRNTVRRDQSVILPSREKTLEVDAVIRCKGRDDKDIVNVRTHTVRFVQAGDKLTSMHGQKGVVGCIRPARDMPYTAEGIVADLVINPHALPSRMTIGQLLESALGGLVCAKNGEIADGTPFNGITATATFEEISKLLSTNGFSNTGEQVMYDGETGQKIKGFLFYGCTYYQRVKQMVDDKLHARARGPVHILTQQPVEGRSKEGGFRMGDMERDCIAAHGSANVAWDRFFQQSDYSEIPVCEKCCTIAMPRAPADQRSLIVNHNELTGFCQLCKTSGSVYNVPMPYATKLFSMELMSAHIRPEFILDINPDINPYTTAAVGIKRAEPNQESRIFGPAVQFKRRRLEPVSQVPAGFGVAAAKPPVASHPSSPPHMASSPPYMASSPPYMPSSPPYMPSSPPYMPSSPPYMPSSPTSTSSPVYMTDSPSYSSASSYHSDADMEDLEL